MERTARKLRRELPIVVRLKERAVQLINRLFEFTLLFLICRICVRLYYGTPLEWLHFNGVPYTKLVVIVAMAYLAWRCRHIITRQLSDETPEETQ